VNSVCLVVAEGNEAWSEIIHESWCQRPKLFMNDLEPDDVPLNFLRIYGRHEKRGKRKI